MFFKIKYCKILKPSKTLNTHTDQRTRQKAANAKGERQRKSAVLRKKNHHHPSEMLRVGYFSIQAEAEVYQGGRNEAPAV